MFCKPDGYVIDNSLQSSEQDVRLEDFFWTGSGDGPPSYIRRPIKVSGMDGEHGRDTIVKTSTVLATVYIDGSLVLLSRLAIVKDNPLINPFVM